MRPWTPRIKRGSTYRVPITLADEMGVPVKFMGGEFIITPDNCPELRLTQANGQLTLDTTFVWKGNWAAGSTYLVGDVVGVGTGKARDYWKALRSNTNVTPGIGEDWKPFAQFEVLIEPADTTECKFKEAAWRLKVQFTNGDTDSSLMKGLLLVTEN